MVLLAVAPLHRLDVQRLALLLRGRAAPAELHVCAVGPDPEGERSLQNVLLFQQKNRSTLENFC